MVARRGMATEKQLKTRILGTQNIAKITKSMKMVSAAKLRGDQARLNAVRPFAEWTGYSDPAKSDLEDLDVSEFPQKNLIVVMATDKGLCGGVNTIMCRMLRGTFAKLDQSGKDYEVVVLGEKGKAQLRRLLGDKIVFAATDRSMPYSFDLAASLAQETLQSEFDSVHLVYNTFVSAIAYTPTIVSLTANYDTALGAESKFALEPQESSEMLLNLFEYSLASRMYACMLENATSEQSSRMSAMENASNNASEMIDSLTLQYNRARQARITTELIEIISGASALED